MQNKKTRKGKNMEITPVLIDIDIIKKPKKSFHKKAFASFLLLIVTYIVLNYI